jgi:phosphoribosylanthranilate isomerase
MPSSVKIKICGLTREEDVEQALELGADYCGFIVYPESPRGLSYMRAAELAALVPVGKRVVVDVETEIDDLKRLREMGFDYYQIHTRQEVDSETLAAYSETVGKQQLWLAPRVAPEDSFHESILDFADTILIDTFSKDQVGGTGQTGDWERFSKLQGAHPNTHWVLAGGLNSQNVHEAIASTGARHIDVNSGVESQPGIKDWARLRQLFDHLRV